VTMLLSTVMNIEKKHKIVGAEALLEAAKHGHESTVRTLLQHGAFCNNDDDEMNPMLAALRYGHPNVVHALLEHEVPPKDPYKSVFVSEFETGWYPRFYGHGFYPTLIVGRKSRE
jgi:ankyrin repeat protein